MIKIKEPKRETFKLITPTSSAVVSEVQIRTSSEEGRDCMLSCMYKESTVSKMSSRTRYVTQIQTGILNARYLHKVRLAYLTLLWKHDSRTYWQFSSRPWLLIPTKNPGEIRYPNHAWFSSVFSFWVVFSPRFMSKSKTNHTQEK